MVRLTNYSLVSSNKYQMSSSKRLFYLNINQFLSLSDVHLWLHSCFFLFLSTLSTLILYLQLKYQVASKKFPKATSHNSTVRNGIVDFLISFCCFNFFFIFFPIPFSSFSRFSFTYYTLCFFGFYQLLRGLDLQYRPRTHSELE